MRWRHYKNLSLNNRTPLKADPFLRQTQDKCIAQDDHSRVEDMLTGYRRRNSRRLWA